MEAEPDRADAVATPVDLAQESAVSDETALSSEQPPAAEDVQPPTVEDVEASAEPDLDAIAAKAAKADEYLLLAQRTQADFENYRKRAARDAALAQARGIAKLAKELLPAIDNLDRALAAAEAYVAAADDSASPGDGQFIDGLKLVHAEMLAALGRVGIEPFSPAGEPFDPQHHEAVAQHQVEGQAPGTVIEVYQQGFRHGDSVLRPARVLVAA